MSMTTKLAYLLVFSLLLWSIGAPSLLNFAHAAQVSNFSDTLSDSNLSALSAHDITFTANDAINPSDTLTIQLDPTSNAFTEAGSAATSTDIAFYANGSAYSVVNTCTSGNQIQAAANYNNGSNENLTLTLCGAAAPISTGAAIEVQVGTSTKLWTNPASAGSYVIRLGGTAGISGDTRVAVLQNVTVTASIDTSFTFTVSGLATSSALNGETILTTGSSTATTLPFNTLDPSASSTLGQELSVATNARNGFVVTVQEDQPLTDTAGAYIPLFHDGASTTVPTAWSPPSNTLDQPWTYGELGVTSDDSDEGGGEFVGGKYAGNIDVPRPVFSHTGPSDGTTQNKGKARVFYSIEIGSLQPAGDDYTNTLTYVATPTF